MNRMAKVVNRYGLTGTPNHPIFTSDGIKSLINVKDTDVTYIWNPQLLSTEKSPIGATRNRHEGNLEFIIGITENGNPHQSHYTVKYGSIILERLRRDLSFITKTVTHSTMTSPIWNSYATRFTLHNIWTPKEEKTQAPALNRITQRYALFLKMDGGKAKNSRLKESATPLSFGMHPNTSTDAYSAEELFSVTESSRSNIAQRNADGNTERVYNIQVEDAPEYFANGILVHNCITLALCAWQLKNSGGNVEIGFASRTRR
jgi:hypothetical protein